MANAETLSPEIKAASSAKNDVYAVFCGPIDQQSVQKMFFNFATATNPSSDVSTVHLLFQSTGGTVSEAVCLYNFFKAFPVDLTLYNVGAIYSAGVIAYLGAKKRHTSARASFMIHRTHITSQATKAPQLKAFTDMIALDDGRTESILREHIRLPDWDALDQHDLFFSGEEAVSMGLADEIGGFSPPPGSQIYNI